jgi:hypothetical protein
VPGSSRPTWPWRGCIRPTCEVRSASFSVPFTWDEMVFFSTHMGGNGFQIWGIYGFDDLLICFFLNVFFFF